MSVVLLDGATGTELSRRGCNTRLPLWSARPLVERPDVVETVHRDYLRAGADVITACTFRTHERSLSRGDWAGRGDELNLAAVDAARRAREREGKRHVRIAGSIAPLEDCYRPELVPPSRDLAREHGLQARSLASCGADMLLVETMNTRCEAEAAVEQAVATGLPTWCSFVTTGHGRLLSGEPLPEAARAVEGLGASAVLVNCVPAVDILGDLRMLAETTDLPVGAYPNIGHAHDVDGWCVDLMVSPDELARVLVACREAGAGILGGCCGTQPLHLAALAAALRGSP